MSKKKKKKSKKMTINPLELLRTIRKPNAPRTKVIKDKRKYSRKEKHKKDYQDEK
jgi:hypothetical protein